LDWIGEFFRTIPLVFSALWDFGDGWRSVGVTVGSVVLLALFGFLALRTRDSMGWVSATFGTMAAFVGAFWLFGIIPSAWIFFADSYRPLLEDTIIPGAIVIGDLEVATDFYNVFRDTVVVIETGVAMGAMAFLALWIQKRWPRGLAEGEEKAPATGGYK
jgi:hypothetical protein